MSEMNTCDRVRICPCMDPRVLFFCRQLGWRDVLRSEMTHNNKLSVIYSDGIFSHRKQAYFYLQEWLDPEFDFFCGVQSKKHDVNSRYFAVRMDSGRSTIRREAAMLNRFLHRKWYTSKSSVERLKRQFDFITRGPLAASGTVFRAMVSGVSVVREL